MKKVTLLIIAMLGLAGCPGNKGSSNNNYNNGLVAGCVNCGFNAAAFSQAVSAEIPQGVLNLTLAGDANQMNAWAHNGQNPLFSYQGPISVAGTLNVVSVIPFGMCQLPPGQYSLRTVQVGTYNVGVFQVPAVELLGPVRMIVSLAEGTILTNGNGVITGFGAMLIGQQGPMMMNNGWGGYQQNMGLSGCMDSIGVRF